MLLLKWPLSPGLPRDPPIGRRDSDWEYNFMVRINLLPVRQIKRRQQAVNELLIFCLAFVGLLVVGTMVFGITLHKVNTLKEDIAALKIEKNSYNKILKQIEELKKKKKSLEAKTATIEKLKKGSQVGVRILDEVALRTPSNRMWLKSLKQSANSLKLAGVALDNATIAQYMYSLAGSKIFVTADLDNSSQTEVAGQKLKSFSLSVGVQQDEADVEGKKEQKAGNIK